MKYRTHYVHKVSNPNGPTPGEDVELADSAFADSKTLGKALRTAGVLLRGARVREFRAEGHRVVVFPVLPGVTTYHHAVILTAGDWLTTEVERVVGELWQRWSQQGSATAEHLWFRRGALAIAPDKPEGFELGDNERLPSHIIRSALCAWVLERARRLPCLP